jgi:hypothetical protein
MTEIAVHLQLLYSSLSVFHPCSSVAQTLSIFITCWFDVLLRGPESLRFLDPSSDEGKPGVLVYGA